MRKTDSNRIYWTLEVTPKGGKDGLRMVRGYQSTHRRGIAADPMWVLALGLAITALTVAAGSVGLRSAAELAPRVLAIVALMGLSVAAHRRSRGSGMAAAQVLAPVSVQERPPRRRLHGRRVHDEDAAGLQPGEIPIRR